jgi:uncharacterized membrane protein HdeD (DUF308 family)
MKEIRLASARLARSVAPLNHEVRKWLDPSPRPGVGFLVNPGADLRLIRWLVGLFLAGWGVLRLVQVARASRRDRTWLVLSGAAAAGAGIVVLAWPAITETVLVFILVVGGLSLAAVDLVGAVNSWRRRDPGWWLHLLRGIGTLLLVVVLLVWPEETLNVVRVLAAVLLVLWGATTLGEAYQSPIRDNAYRRELDLEVRRII